MRAAGLARFLVTSLVALACGDAALAQSLLVANGDGNSVFSYSLPGGGPPATFVGAGSGGLNNPRALTFGSDGNLYVSSAGASGSLGRILKYDGSTGAFLGVFATTADNNPFGLRFGQDGTLYVSNLSSNSVSRYSAAGALLGTFVSAGSGGLNAPRDLLFDNGDLLVSSLSSTSNALSGAVLRYDGITGAFEGVFASNVDPRGLTLGPGGDLFVASFATDDVRRYNGATGASEGSFASGITGGAVGLAFGPDSDLYVSSFTDGRIFKYDPSGSLLGIFASGDGLSSPRLMAVSAVPEGDTFALLSIGLVVLSLFTRGRQRR